MMYRMSLDSWQKHQRLSEGPVGWRGEKQTFLIGRLQELLTTWAAKSALIGRGTVMTSEVRDVTGGKQGQ